MVGAVLMLVAGARVRGQPAVRRAARRGDDRRHQPQRQRGRPVPRRSSRRRSRSSSTDRAADELFARYQLVGLDRDGRRGAGRGRGRRRPPSTPGCAELDAYRAVIVGYAVDRRRAGARCSARRRRPSRCRHADGRGRADPHAALGPAPVAAASSLRLSALFALDAFAGGFVMQSFIAFWFQPQFGVDPAMLGAILFAANILAAAVGARGRPARGALRPHQHDGVHAPAIERAADPRAVHADAASSPSLVLLVAVQHQPDGRADAAVLHDGGRRPRRAVGRRRRHRHRAQPGRGRVAAHRRRRCIVGPAFIGCAVRHRRAASRSSTTCCSTGRSAPSPHRRSNSRGAPEAGVCRPDPRASRAKRSKPTPGRASSAHSRRRRPTVAGDLVRSVSLAHVDAGIRAARVVAVRDAHAFARGWATSVRNVRPAHAAREACARGEALRGALAREPPSS